MNVAAGLASLSDLALADLASAADVAVSRAGDTVARERSGAAAGERFLLFSLSKPLLAVAVLVLVDAGMLALDTRIATLIPEFAAGGKEDVTIDDVLTHRGGYQEGRPEATPIDVADFEDRERALAAICALPRSAELVGVGAYHALSFSILVDVAERAARQEFREFCRQQIFAPLGMTHTTWGLPPELRSSAVPLVGPSAHDWELAGMYDGLLGAGNAWSTADDIHCFFLMLRNGGTLGGSRILGDATVAHMTAPHVAAHGQAGAWAFGYGLFIGSESGALSGRGATASERCFGHAGFTATQAWHDPRDDLTFVALTNSCVGQNESDRRFQILADEVRRRFA